MASSNFNMRLDDELRNRAFPVLESYGLSPSQAFKLFLTQVAETNTVPLSFDYQPQPQLQPSQATLRAIEELESGGGTKFDSLDELLATHPSNQQQVEESNA